MSEESGPNIVESAPSPGKPAMQVSVEATNTETGESGAVKTDQAPASPVGQENPPAQAREVSVEKETTVKERATSTPAERVPDNKAGRVADRK
jgi:hypothetical protein